MSTDARPLLEYLNSLEKELAAGNSTEHTHRLALKTPLKSPSLVVRRHHK